MCGSHFNKKTYNNQLKVKRETTLQRDYEYSVTAVLLYKFRTAKPPNVKASLLFIYRRV